MKHNKHVVKIFIYNPNNLKEIIGYKDFIIEYIPTKKWNVYLITVNNKYCGINIDISKIFNGNFNISPRKLIAESVKNYINNNTIQYQNRVKIYYPNSEIFLLVQKIFKEIILPINNFKNKEELTKFGLILNYE
jgi:hypothetical protein